MQRPLIDYIRRPDTLDDNAIAQLRKEILGKFPGAFIIAFKNGVKINVNEAISEFKARKK